VPFAKVADALVTQQGDEPSYTALCNRLRERGASPFGQNLAHQHFKRWQRERRGAD
jgi:hypothetical protein